jgi:exopolyphosphatase/guanosine-5'-triphosphate,3'-diphosphate pyrophosphatase
VRDDRQPLPGETIELVKEFTRAQLAQHGFDFPLPSDAIAVGTGGTITTLRTILAARQGQSLGQTDTRVELDAIRSLSAELSGLSLEQRKLVAGLPPARADVYPVALATLIAVAEAGRFNAYVHSFYNLRFGLAAEALS